MELSEQGDFENEIPLNKTQRGFRLYSLTSCFYKLYGNKIPNKML